MEVVKTMIFTGLQEVFAVMPAVFILMSFRKSLINPNQKSLMKFGILFLTGEELIVVCVPSDLPICFIPEIKV